MQLIPMVLSNFHIYCELLKYELKTKDLLRDLFGCHDNQATTEVTCVVNLCCPKKSPCGFHGNQATIATTLVANLYCLKEPQNVI